MGCLGIAGNVYARSKGHLAKHIYMKFLTCVLNVVAVISQTKFRGFDSYLTKIIIEIVQE